MTASLLLITLMMPLTFSVASPLSDGARLTLPDHLGGRARVAFAESAPAIAQIFPDISNPDIQFLLQADTLLTLGFTEAGIAIYEQELQRLRDQGDYLREAETLIGIASDLQVRGQLQNALSYYQRGLAIYDENATILTAQEINFFVSREAASKLGSVYLALGQPEQAIAAYEQGVAIARRAEISWAEGNALSHLGVAYRLAGYPEQALEAYQQALSRYQELGIDPYESPKIWNRIGLIYQAQGQFEAALAAYEQGLIELTDPQNFGQISSRILTLENISHLYGQQGQPDQAAAYAQQAEALLTETFANNIDITLPGNWLRQTLALEDIGEFYLTEREFDRATHYFERALAIARQSTDSYAEINLLDSISLHYTQAGQLERTLPYEEQAIEVLREMGLIDNEATALKGLATLYQTLGQWEQALATYQQALSTYETAHQEYGGQIRDIAQVLQGIGQVYEAQAQFEPATLAYQQALARYQEVSFPYGQLFVLERLAYLYREQGQDDRAQHYTQQAQALQAEIDLPLPD